MTIIIVLATIVNYVATVSTTLKPVDPFSVDAMSKAALYAYDKISSVGQMKLFFNCDILKLFIALNRRKNNIFSPDRRLPPLKQFIDLSKVYCFL